MSLLDFSFGQGFQCTRCGPHPQTLIMDATGLSFQRQLDFWRDIDLTDTPDVKVAEGK